MPADVARVHARLGVAVVRGLLLDLLATGDRGGVDAALEVFARRYAGRWWEDQAEAPVGAPEKPTAPRSVRGDPGATVNATAASTSMRRLPSVMAVAWNA